MNCRIIALSQCRVICRPLKICLFTLGRSQMLLIVFFILFQRPQQLLRPPQQQPPPQQQRLKIDGATQV